MPFIYYKSVDVFYYIVFHMDPTIEEYKLFFEFLETPTTLKSLKTLLYTYLVDTI